MTSRLVVWLGIAACLQLAAVAFLYWPDSGTKPAAAANSDTLLPLPRDEIARIGITGVDGDSVMLVRRDGQWMLEANALPAATPPVGRLFDALSRPAGFPVARSENARKRFEVAADHFQRRITLADHVAGTDSPENPITKTATVYLGTSPGMRRVHARRGDSDVIQSIALSTFDVPATVDGWLDPNLLSMDAIERVTVAGGEWKKEDNTWTATGDGAIEKTAARDALVALERTLANLQVTGILADEARSEVPAQAAIEFAIASSSQATSLRLVPNTDGEGGRLYSSQFDRWFTLSQFDHDRLAEVLRALSPRNKIKQSLSPVHEAGALTQQQRMASHSCCSTSCSSQLTTA